MKGEREGGREGVELGQGGIFVILDTLALALAGPPVCSYRVATVTTCQPLVTQISSLGNGNLEQTFFTNSLGNTV